MTAVPPSPLLLTQEVPPLPKRAARRMRIRAPAPIRGATTTARYTAAQAVEFVKQAKSESGQGNGQGNMSRTPAHRSFPGRLLDLWIPRQVRSPVTGTADTDHPDGDSCQNQTEAQRHQDPDRYRSGIDILIALCRHPGTVPQRVEHFSCTALRDQRAAAERPGCL